MRTSLDAALAHIAEFEGGFVDHPADPGGATNLGITLDTYRHLLNPHGTVEDLQRLTWSEVAPIYERAYWQTVRGDELPAGVDLVVVDMAVNAGPTRAVKLLQRSVGTAQDGLIGPITLAAVRRQPPAALVRAYTSTRLHYYRSLKHWPTFGRGWTRRARTAETRALALAAAR